MSIRQFLVVAAITTVSVATSFANLSAQDGERPDRGGERGRFGGGGGPGGQGGFGGGLGGFGGGFARPSGDMLMVGLLRNDKVREELEIMPDQEEALKKMAERQRGDRPETNFRDASESERAKMLETLQAEMQKRASEAKAQLEEVLLPAQFERLEQIAVQAQGASVLATPEMAKKLTLTAAQTEKLQAEMKTASDGLREKMGELFRSGDRDSIREKMAEKRKEDDAKLVAILDESQKSEFEKLKGEPFDVASLAMGGPGGPGGFGGGPGGGGPGGDRGDRPRGERTRPPVEE